jgi:5-methyltetrahydropteroyltriglutamate--homocysteine methyltransferase
MKTSTDGILTTHVGSLPRPKDVTDLVFAKEREEAVDESEFNTVIERSVNDTLAKQKEAGITIPSDGEMSKISYATYIKDRLTGFAGDSPRRAPADLKQFPGFLERQSKGGGTPSYRRPMCVGPIEVKNLEPLHDDIRWMKAAMAAHGFEEGFMNSATPGVIALFQPSEYHSTHEAYLEDVAEAMRHEYEAIVASGLILQLDSPDLGLGRHMMFPDLSDDEFVRQAEVHIEVLNHALRNIPGDKVRMHVCWGNYEGPHICDIALAKVLPAVLKAKPRGLLFETSNPRHSHEWRAWQENKIPDDYVLIPGVIDSTTNFVEHPQLVADRICRYADIVGRERVIAGSDCGFATFAGFGAVDEDIVWAKLSSLSEGAAMATATLWGK